MHETDGQTPAQTHAPKPWNGFLAYHVFIFGLFVLALLGSAVIYDNYLRPASEGDFSDDAGETADCNVRGIELHGDMYTYLIQGNPDDQRYNSDAVSSDQVMDAIARAESDDDIKAILLEVDSNGGEPVAGEEVAQALLHATKPSVAMIRQSGLSAAYWAASGAKRIFASRNSDVGSIGVTMSYVDESSQKGKFVQLSSGKFKDTLNPNKPLTPEERDLLMRDTMIIHKNFVEDVAKNRGLPVDAVAAIADGSTVLGSRAVELKLVDEIGGMAEVKEYLRNAIGAPATICWH